jgi:hypothetical protein
MAGGLDCRVGLTQNISLTESAGDMARAGLFLQRAKLFLANSHQNSHSPKIKMAAYLAASHLADFKVFLAPQVGLEPTTLRLTARILPCSAVLDIALSCLFLCRYSNRFDEAECRDYPEIPTILKECPYKNPYSDCGRLHLWRQEVEWHVSLDFPPFTSNSCRTFLTGDSDRISQQFDGSVGCER